MAYEAINIRDKFSKFDEIYSPRAIARLNDYIFKLARVKGDFVWHRHVETDEVFMVIEGALTIEFRDGRVELKTGEMFVVPKGAEHRPRASEECLVMLIEPGGTVNTGDAGGELTQDTEIWI